MRTMFTVWVMVPPWRIYSLIEDMGLIYGGLAGMLRLSLSKEYYEKAGLQGKPAQFNGRKGHRYCKWYPEFIILLFQLIEFIVE